ncbi:MAG: nucleotide exchange factor GrpE [Deltaproteobacteria bacterium]|nr:nucleotide exchange factor GrpE [Deltaproteobacteria bacterium]
MDDNKEAINAEGPVDKGPQEGISPEDSQDPKKKGAKKRHHAETLKEVQKKLKEKDAEAKEHYDRVLRTSAEFENFKKRSEREMADFRKFASEAVFKEILPIIDNLERALDVSGNSDCEAVIGGVEMTLKQFMSSFSKFGVVPIEAVGKPFDPRFHEAVMGEESDTQPNNIVLREMQKGYMINDRLLRPSMVVVAKQAAECDEKKD